MRVQALLFAGQGEFLDEEEFSTCLYIPVKFVPRRCCEPEVHSWTDQALKAQSWAALFRALKCNDSREVAAPALSAGPGSSRSSAAIWQICELAYPPVTRCLERAQIILVSLCMFRCGDDDAFYVAGGRAIINEFRAAITFPGLACTTRRRE